VNVLFITVDQWRGDCLSSLGHPVVQTPALDRLAAGGVRFRNH
jgi:arylsulfatase A-like enzyme